MSEERKLHPLFETAWENLDTEKALKSHYDRLEKSWERIKDLEDYLIPSDVSLFLRPNKLRRVLYKRRADG